MDIDSVAHSDLPFPDSAQPLVSPLHSNPIQEREIPAQDPARRFVRHKPPFHA